MKLQEVFDQLTAGEFSQLSIGGAAAGVIDDTNYARVLGHVNLGLTALYTRFTLKERRITFPLNPASDTYLLSVDDVLKIEKVTTDADFELGLNNESDPYSCKTPSLNSIRIAPLVLAQGQDLPDDLKTGSITVTYLSNHPKLKMELGTLLPEQIEVELPYTHLQALLFFVASRVHNPIGMGQEFNAGNIYYAKYEAECQGLQGKGMQVDKGDQNTRLSRGGWV